MDHLYSAEELEALHRRSLELFLYFKSVCDRGGLLCYLCGGGCIGALREGGFIPWDDDLDVFMPREDYEKLPAVWEKYADTARYAIYYPHKGFCDHNIFTTVRDGQTTFIKPYQADLDINQGLMLDIMPLDGCPSSRFARKMQKFWAMVYFLYCSRLPAVNRSKPVELASRFLLAVIPRRLGEKIWMCAKRHMTRYPIAQCDKITELCAGPKYWGYEYPKEWFASAVSVPFEDTEVVLPVGCDSYLRMAFGDYMQRPPKEQQIPHHDAVRVDMEQGYLRYKGVDYCVGASQTDKPSAPR